MVPPKETLERLGLGVYLETLNTASKSSMKQIVAMPAIMRLNSLLYCKVSLYPKEKYIGNW